MNDIIETDSTSIENDLKILEYCKNNKTDSKCSCIYPPEDILKLNKSAFTNYYCWFKPCLTPKQYYVTTIIKQEKTYCNLTLCEISIGDVVMNDATIEINNDCANVINPVISSFQNISDTFNYDKNLIILPHSTIFIVIICILSFLFIYIF